MTGMTALTTTTRGRTGPREAGPVPALRPLPAPAGGLLQRKCACGGTPGPSGECAECRRKRLLQRRSDGTAQAGGVPSIVHEVLRSPGAPLDADTRAFMEPRFGHDFSRVRVHTDGRAAESARAVSALAYTVGRDVVFGAGRYAPGSGEGRRLLAHELAHVVQQSPETARGSHLRIAPEADAKELEAESASAALIENAESSGPLRLSGSGFGSVLQRKIAVGNPAGVPAGAPVGTTNETIINDYISKLCPDFEASSGKVEPKAAGYCPAGPAASTAPVACGCLCEMHGLADTWTIQIDDNDWPHTDDAAKVVTVHSPFSGVQFGAWAAGPPAHRTTEPNWLVLGHELCGHGMLFARGTHPVGPPPTHGGRPSHDPTVTIENQIAAEHGIPAADLRGMFADPHHGESFAKVTIAEFPTGSANVGALPPAEQRKLDIAEAFINSAPVKMDVVGHSDQQGSNAAANRRMSRRRARNVKADLVSRGIRSGRFLHTDGVGDAECAAPGDQPGCRKVEIFMFIMEGASVTHP